MDVKEFKSVNAVAVRAFSKAISEGRLSENPKEERYVGNYMWMGNYDGKDLFKHAMTRKYDV